MSLDLVQSLQRKVNNRLLKYSYKLRMARLPARLPNSLDIESSSFCSLDCFKCPRRDMERPDGHMSLELFKKIIDDAAPEVSWCWLHLFGEPLSNRYLPEMIAYARSRDVLCGISSNAVGLTEKRGRELANAGLDTIIISLDAVTKEMYDQVRHGGDFERVNRNTEVFLNLPESRKIKNIIIQMIKFDLNKDEAEQFIEKWRGPGRKVHIKDEETWAGIFGDGENKATIARVPCDKLWERLTIDWSGNVTICCRDHKVKEKVGNVNEQHLKDIWNNNRMREIRRLMVQGKYDDLPLCKNCREWAHHLVKHFEEY